MVKHLTDNCLHVIAMNINCYDDLDTALTFSQKEILLKRMSIHQQFTTKRIEFVKRFLFSSNLKKVEFCHTKHVTDKFLEDLAKENCKFEDIIIENCKNVSDDGLFLLLQHQSSLSFLKIKCLPEIVGNSLCCLQSDNLQQLILNNLIQLKDHHVVQIVANCPTIRYLDLQYCRELSDSCIIGSSAILKGNMVVLNLSGNSLLTDQSLESLMKNNQNLKELKLYGLNKLTDVAISKILCRLNLTYIDISYTCGYNSGSCQLDAEHFSNSLQSFISCGVQVQRNFFYPLMASCSNLTCLELCGVDAVNDTVIRYIIEAVGIQLKEIDLSYCRNFTDNGLQFVVQQCKKLEHLALQYFTGTAKGLLKYTSHENQEQAKCLKKLYLSGCRNINGSQLKSILSCLTNLLELSLSAVPGVNNDLLYVLSTSCQQLKLVNFKACCEITDAGICSLIFASQLVNIVLSGVPKITDQTIFAMASRLACSLKQLHVSGCNLLSRHVLVYLKDVSINGVYVQHRTHVTSGQLMARNLDTGQFCRADLL